LFLIIRRYKNHIKDTLAAQPLPENLELERTGIAEMIWPPDYYIAE
jgi:hypothetical protein